MRLLPVSLLVTAFMLVGCSPDDPTSSGDGVDSGSDLLSESDRETLDASGGEGHADRVIAAGSNAALCAALDGAIGTGEALDAASGDELVALLGPSQAPMDQAATVLAAEGFALTAEHYGRYRDALAETELDIDMADQASRDRANERFAAIQAQSGPDTATELGGLALVCGLG